MAEIRRAHRVVAVFIVATLLAAAMWANDRALAQSAVTYETEITLSIKGNVWSGKLSEPAGGTRCTVEPRRPVWVRFQKLKADGSWKKLFAVSVQAEKGVYSVTIDSSNKLLSKKTVRLFSKGTFRAWLMAGFITTNEDGIQEWCGESVSTPVKKR